MPPIAFLFGSKDCIPRTALPNPEANPPKALAALKAINAVNKGRRGLIVSAIFMKVSANVKPVLMKAWNVPVSDIPLMSLANSSFTLAIWVAKAIWAVTASSVKEVPPARASCLARSANSNSLISGRTLPICLKPAISSAILINLISPSSRPDSSSLNLFMASLGPTNFPSSVSSSTPNDLKNSIVLGLWIRVKIVRKPVAILSALSRVVALTLVNKPISSSRSPPASTKTPPTLLMAAIKSPDSTANLPATALIAPS